MTSLRSFITRRPGWVVGLWFAAAIAATCFSPDLTRVAAEGQGELLGENSESFQAANELRRAWPGDAYESLAVAAFHRDSGLTAADFRYVKLATTRLVGRDRPAAVLRALGPDSPPEIAERLLSRDGTVELVAVQLSTSFVAPATREAVSWLEAQIPQESEDRPAGLDVRWVGDAPIGRDYMSNVRTSLDRAAAATVLLLLVVLLAVYRSFWLAIVPLATIGVALAISRACLAWMALFGWEVSSLVELFLIAVLFGCGTDFCLLLSWSLGEHWDRRDPGRAVREALERSSRTLLTSAGTVIVGLSLMRATRFKLFSSTGPSVAMGLAVAVAATLTLAPALLVVLARLRPRSFDGLAAPASPLWERISRSSLSRPLSCWSITILAMAPLALLGLRADFVQDVVTEMPPDMDSVRNLRWLSGKFDPGTLSPLSIALESDSDLRNSEGLALIDDVSRLLARRRDVLEVRSATQPLGSPAPLEAARLSDRLHAVNEGHARMESGARELEKGLNEGAAKIRLALWLEKRTGLALSGPTAAAGGDAAWNRSPEAQTKGDDPRVVLADQLARAAVGAGDVASGASRARVEVASMLGDPVGRRSLDRLLITPQTLREHPELLRGLDAYVTADGRLARIDVAQGERIYSTAAMDQVVDLRRRVRDFVGDFEGGHVKALVAGENAESADIRALVRSDQVRSWYIMPIGVFLVLLLTLRDPAACLNLVATMMLTYAFALGATRLLFVDILGAPGLDWKVPYFLFVLLLAVGVDYNVFLMARLREESRVRGLREAVVHAVARTGGLISSAAAITACSFASFLFSPLGSLRQLGFALVVGIAADALIVRPLLVPCGHWLMKKATGSNREPGAQEAVVRSLES